LRLDTLVEQIDTAFGETPPFTSAGLGDEERDVLLRVFGDQGYQVYLQDQVNRQIIRDYLTNAVMLGFLPQPEMQDLEELIGNRDARASLSLHMLMSSVEQAAELLSGGAPARLKLLEPDTDSPPHIHLIRS
jgi:hypothetical protein